MQWGQIQYLPVETLLDVLQFSGLVAFVLFNKNNGKLISLSKGKKKSENIILSNLLQRNFFSSLLSVQSCLRYGSQYQSGNIWPKEIKVRRYGRLMNGLLLSACNCYYKPNRKVPSTRLSEISLRKKKKKRSGVSPLSVKAQSMRDSCHKDNRWWFSQVESQLCSTFQPFAS